MKLYEVKDWIAVHFKDRTILRKDIPLLSKEQYKQLLTTEVEPMTTFWHYKAVEGGTENADMHRNDSECY